MAVLVKGKIRLVEEASMSVWQKLKKRGVVEVKS